MIAISDIMIGWTAGIIDGEGSVLAGPRPLQKGKHSVGWYTRIAVSNTDIRMLEKLKELWGGYLSGAKINRPSRCEKLYTWTISHKMLIPILEKIEPFLIVKRRQAQLVLELQRRISAKNWVTIIDSRTGRASGRALPAQEIELRRQLFLEIKKLNHRGGYHGRNSTSEITALELANRICASRNIAC